MAQEAAKGGAASSMFAKKTMAPEEARMILGVEAGSSAEEVAARYAKMFEANEKNGSFYLQSKIHRAKEALDADMLGEEGKGKGERARAARGRARGRARATRRIQTRGGDSPPPPPRKRRDDEATKGKAGRRTRARARRV